MPRRLTRKRRVPTYGPRPSYLGRSRSIYRRPGFRTYKRRGGLTRIPRGIPQSQLVQLTYTEVLYANAINMAVPAYHHIRMNSLFDPQATGSSFSSVSGHTNNGQPMWRDQWAAMYYQYRVHSASIKVTWQPTQQDGTHAGTSTVGTIVITASDAATSGDTDILVNKQRIGARFVDFGGAAYTTNLINIRRKDHPKTALGLSRRQYNDDDATAGGLNSGTNPSKQAYWHILVQNMSTAQALYGFLQVTVKYNCRLFDRIEEVAAS